MEVDSRHQLYLGGLMRVITYGLFHVVALVSMSTMPQGGTDDSRHVELFVEVVVVQ